MKKIVFVLILFAINCLNAQINVIESNLVLQNGVYYLNNTTFTGNALVYYPQDQIKSICEYKEGLKTGNFTSYYYDNSFNKINFKDTSKITQLNFKKTTSKNLIIELIKDTVSSYGKMNAYLNDEIGGLKKLLKFKEKSAEGDLKGKKLEELNAYNDLLFKHKKAIETLTEEQNNLRKIDEKLITEINKKDFIGISKEQYQQKNGIKDGSFISHFENGKISSEGIFKDGKYNGLWTFYHENGNIKGKGNYQMGDGSELGTTGLSRNGRNGQWLIYHENGKISDESNWVDGKSKGVFKSFFPNGQLEEESYIIAGQYEGKFISFYENGKLKVECDYVNGEYNGKYTSWFENGKLKEEGNWVEGNANGVYKSYYENGNLKREGPYTSGKQNGLFKNYYENGNLKSELNLNDTLREGLCKYYYDNGKLKQECNFKEDKVNGVFKSYHENGNLRREGTYINGKQFGLFKNYFQTGLLSSELILNDTLKDGLCKYYHENGKLKSEKTFKNDVLSGSCKTFYANGKRESEGFYKDDKAQGLFIQYDENGNKKQETNFINGIINGLMTLYYGNGKIDKQFMMKNGKAHGQSKHYFESGVLKLSCTYDTLAKEKITGDTKLFDENGLLLEHSYYNLDGTVLNKLSSNKENISSQKNIKISKSTEDLNTTYQCTWCGKNIKGVFNGYDKDGRHPTNMDIEWHRNVYKEIVEKEDYQNAVKPLENLMNNFGIKTPKNYIESLIMAYEFCTPKCAHEHKKSKD